MFFNWATPHYGELQRFERIVRDHVNNVSSQFKQAILDIPLGYWLLDRQGQAKTFFFGTLLLTLLWLIILEYSSRSSKRTRSAATALAEQDNVLAPQKRRSILKISKTVDLSHNPDRSPLWYRTGRISDPGYQSPFPTQYVSRNHDMHANYSKAYGYGIPNPDQLPLRMKESLELHDQSEDDRVAFHRMLNASMFGPGKQH